MKSGLGDDAEDGWLLLGAQGGSVSSGSTAVRFDGGASLAEQQVLSVAAAGVAAGVALSIAAGSASGGGRPTGSPFFNQPLR